MPLADLVDPPLTTVDIAAEQMSRQAAQLMLDTLREPQRVPTMLVLTPTLVVRRSTAAPPSR